MDIGPQPLVAYRIGALQDPDACQFSSPTSDATVDMVKPYNELACRLEG